MTDLNAGTIQLKPSGDETLLEAVVGNDYFQLFSPLPEIVAEVEKYFRSLGLLYPSQPSASDAQASPSEPTANQTEEEQAGTKPRKESKRKRIFGLRIDYLIAGIILDVLISVASLVLFPDWARSNLTRATVRSRWDRAGTGAR